MKKHFHIKARQIISVRLEKIEFFGEKKRLFPTLYFCKTKSSVMVVVVVIHALASSDDDVSIIEFPNQQKQQSLSNKI